MLGQNPPTVQNVMQVNQLAAMQGYRPQQPGQTNNYFTNINLNFSNVPSQPLVGTTLQEYISRAFKKCITAPERVEMSKLLKKSTEANKSK
jgi:hypothetical protein